MRGCAAGSAPHHMSNVRGFEENDTIPCVHSVCAAQSQISRNPDAYPFSIFHILSSNLITMTANSLWVYEVTVKVDAFIKEDYAGVIRHHVEVISALPGFHPISTWHEEESDDKDTVTWVMRYFADERAAIQNYFDTLAPSLRAGTVAFGDKVSATRRILRPSNRV